MRCISTLILILLMLPTTVQACRYSYSRQDAYICPIDGVQIVHTYASTGDIFGKNLDLQLLGVCRSQPVYMAQCTNDGMVMYKTKFTPEEVAILKEYVPTDEYQQMGKDHTSTYWRAAKLKEKLGVPLYERWFTMLQATWEASSDKYESYARETINAIEALLAEPLKYSKKEIETWQLLLGELYRRVGDFDKAETYFNDLLAKPTFKDHDSNLVIINYELELIAKKDQTSHLDPNPLPNR